MNNMAGLELIDRNASLVYNCHFRVGKYDYYQSKGYL